jgi:CRP/FNR family transcriptional regulator
MLLGTDLARIKTVFPALAEVSQVDWKACSPTIRQYPGKTLVFTADDFEYYAIFILQGTVRITNLGDHGRAAGVNRIHAGDVCSLMILSTLSQCDYPGFMTSETEVEALFVRKSSLIQWMSAYAQFRKYIFQNIFNVFLHISDVLHNVIFQRLDLRLARLLLEKTSLQTRELRITHEELALELGTAREVISRMIKRFKEEGLLDTKRGQLTILQRSKLEQLQFS